MAMLKERYDEIYEEELKPAIEKARDPFRSSDLDVDMSSNVIGRVLKEVSLEDDNDLDVVDQWPYVFSREDNTEYASGFTEETRQIGVRAAQVLEEKGEIGSNELNEVVGYLVEDGASIQRETLRKGQVKDYLEEFPEVKYILEKEKFEWSN